MIQDSAPLIKNRGLGSVLEVQGQTPKNVQGLTPSNVQGQTASNVHVMLTGASLGESTTEGENKKDEQVRTTISINLSSSKKKSEFFRKL